MFFSIFILMVSCVKKENEDLPFEINLPLTVTPQNINQWGVTRFGPLKLRYEPKEDSDIINHLPLGSVLEILKKENELRNFENMLNYWYFINYKGEKGWIFGYYIDIYNKEEEAIKRSEVLLFGNKTNLE
ncbi:MAG TPA: SH3 domain-containing protein [Spirochaetota bacterium]|nr:SH3 domain-containing protein [Spirochaetota bacterium]